MCFLLVKCLLRVLCIPEQISYNIALLDEIIEYLLGRAAARKILWSRFTGNFHIFSDRISIYKIDERRLILLESETGLYSDLFP